MFTIESLGSVSSPILIYPTWISCYWISISLDVAATLGTDTINFIFSAVSSWLATWCRDCTGGEFEIISPFGEGIAVLSCFLCFVACFSLLNRLASGLSNVLTCSAVAAFEISLRPLLCNDCYLSALFCLFSLTKASGSILFCWLRMSEMGSFAIEEFFFTMAPSPSCAPAFAISMLLTRALPT